MSSSLFVSSSMPSSSALPSSPFSMVGNGAGGNAALAGQFFGFLQFLQNSSHGSAGAALSLPQISVQTTEDGSIDSEALANAVAALTKQATGSEKTDVKVGDIQSLTNRIPAFLCALPLGDAEALQSLIGQIESSDSGFPQNVLLALTSGVPSDFLPETVATENGVATVTMDQLSELVSSHSDALSNGNILLVAANIAPEDMESLAQSLSAALDKFQTKNEVVESVSAVADTEQAEPVGGNNIHLVLVTFISPVSPAPSEEVNVTEDASSDSAIVPKSGEVTGVPETPEETTVENDNVESNNEAVVTDAENEDDVPASLSFVPAFVPAFVPDSSVKAQKKNIQSNNPVDVNWIALASFIANVAAPKTGSDSVSSDKVSNDKQVSSSSSSPDQKNSVFDSDNDLLAEAGKIMDGARKQEASLSSDAAKPDNTALRFGDAVKTAASAGAKTGTDTGVFSTLSASLSAPLGAAAQTNPAANPLLTNTSAASAHPATQTLSAVIGKISENGEVKAQTLSVELDPPELGKVQIQLSYEKGEPMKVKVLAEKEETLSALRRDSHALRQALDSAGIKTDESSLSFDMSQDGGAFQQTLNQQQNQGERSSSFRVSGGDVYPVSGDEAGAHTIETSLGIVVDAQTGQIRYNIMA